LSSKLFKRAIVESGSCLGPWAPKTADLALSIGLQFMKEYGAQSMDDLRKIPAADFLNASQFNLLAPGIDNYVLPQAPIAYYQSHKLQMPSDGAVLLGSNSLDTLYTFPFYFGPFPNTPAEYQAVLSKFFGDDTPEVLGYYPAGSSPGIMFQVLNAHLCVTCPTSLMAEAITAASYPVYLYEFSLNPAVGDYHNLAAHAAELGEVFGSYLFPFPFDAPLSPHMIDYWTSFAKTGIPSSAVTWPQFDSAKRQYQDLNTVISSKSGFYEEKCGFWERYVQRGPQQLLRTLEYCYQVVA